MASRPDATGLVTDLGGGSKRAADELLTLVYDELRGLTQGHFRQERPNHHLQPTAVVHEAYLKLVDQSRVDRTGRTHFKAVAAQAMRRLLADHARARGREEKSGRKRPVHMYDAFRLGGGHQLDLVRLHDALEKMGELDERQAGVVQLRLFGGLSDEEAARILGVSVRTVERDWRMGQAWLRRELSKGASA
jgi:RNA polymerase sigma factor (TIGR02999 family)